MSQAIISYLLVYCPINNPPFLLVCTLVSECEFEWELCACMHPWLHLCVTYLPNKQSQVPRIKHEMVLPLFQQHVQVLCRGGSEAVEPLVSGAVSQLSLTQLRLGQRGLLKHSLH